MKKPLFVFALLSFVFLSACVEKSLWVESEGRIHPKTYDRFVITNDGKVGIGTKEPEAGLHIVSDTIIIDEPSTGNPQLIIRRNAPGLAGSGGFIRFETRNAAGTLLDGAQLNGGLEVITPGNEQGVLDVIIYKDGSPKVISFNGALASFTPADTGVFALGTSTRRWTTAYLQRLDIQTAISKPDVFVIRDASDKEELLVFNSAIPMLKSSARVAFDTLGEYYDFGSRYQFVDSNLNPTGVYHSFLIHTTGLGDNATKKGVTGLRVYVRDHPSVTAATKGILYGIHVALDPKIDRDNVPYDDVTGIAISNEGDHKGTDALYFSNRRNESEWLTAITIDTWADWGINFGGTFANYGIDMYGINGSARYTSGKAIRIPNNVAIVARNASGTADIPLLKLNTLDQAEIGTDLRVRGKIRAEGFDTEDIIFRDSGSGEPLWRMFEDENGLYLENKKTGKVYKFVLQEIKK